MFISRKKLLTLTDTGVMLRSQVYSISFLPKVWACLENG